MNIVDSSGWIEYIADASNADFFEPAIIDSDHLFVPTICLYEVFKRVLQEFGEERALDAIGIMSLGTIIDLDGQIAVHAAHISHELKLARQAASSSPPHAPVMQHFGPRMNISRALKEYATKTRRPKISHDVIQTFGELLATAMMQYYLIH